MFTPGLQKEIVIVDDASRGGSLQVMKVLAEKHPNITVKAHDINLGKGVTAKISHLLVLPRIYEVGISYSGRTYAEGKKINWKDGFRAIWRILRYNLTQN